MKKLIVGLILAACALPLFAEMDSKEYTFQCVATAAKTNAYVIRGELEAIKVDCVGVATGTVVVTTAELTAFSKATIGADATYLPRYPLSTTAGVAITDGKTNDAAAVIYGKIPLAGLVTVKYTGETAAATTNNVIVTLIYSR